MGKTSTIIYITLACLLLLLISHSPKKPSHNCHRRLKVRTSHQIIFDPIAAQIKRHKQHNHEQEQQSQSDSDDFVDAQDYFNDEDNFNITNRLILLFPRIDVEPKDWYVSEYELTEWNLRQTRREVMHRSERELKLHDKNHDGFVGFDEYEPPNWVRRSDPNSFGYDIGWWKEEHFNASDADGDGLLDITEFNDFLHPADSNNPKLLRWLCKEEIRERDTDKDGKLSFNEFFHGLFDLIRNYDEVHNHNNSQESPARILFAQLDKDSEGFLSDTELLPIIGKLHPSEHYYAKQHADYAMSQADTDKDGRLTLTEMIENPYVFYSTVFSNDDDDYEYHDELR